MELPAPRLPLAASLGVALALGLGLLALLVTAAPEAAPALALGLGITLIAVMIGAATGISPAGRFVALMVLSVAALGADEGVDPLEVAFGLGMVVYVAAWYGATLVGGRRLIRDWADVAMLTFLLVFGIGGVVFGFLQGFGGLDLRSDITCLLALALFFPAREVVVRTERGPQIVAACIVGLGVVASVVSAIRLRTAFAEATAYYEIVDARITSGEVHAMAALVVALLWASAVKTWRSRFLLLGMAVIVLGGLIIARSRAQWIAGLAGLIAAGIVAPSAAKARLVPTVVFGSMAGVLAGVALLGERMALFAIGLLRRFASISSAMTTDISLLNRYVENAAAWSAVFESPVVGNGWGAPVTRYDLLSGSTTTWGFLHNGHAWIAHKTGLVGLGLFLFAFIVIGARAAWASLTAKLPAEHGALGAAGAGLVGAMLLLAYPANPFAILDQMIAVALCLALASGVACRAAR